MAKFIQFQCVDAAGNNGQLWIDATNNVNNVFYRSIGTQSKMIWQKDVGSTSGHCGVLNYIFNKYFPQYRSQKQVCGGSPVIQTIQGNDIGIMLKNGQLSFQNGESYADPAFDNTVISSDVFFKGRKPPIDRILHLNDFSNSNLAYSKRGR